MVLLGLGEEGSRSSGDSLPVRISPTVPSGATIKCGVAGGTAISCPSLSAIACSISSDMTAKTKGNSLAAAYSARVSRGRSTSQGDDHDLLAILLRDLNHRLLHPRELIAAGRAPGRHRLDVDGLANKVGQNEGCAGAGVGQLSRHPGGSRLGNLLDSCVVRLLRYRQWLQPDRAGALGRRLLPRTGAVPQRGMTAATAITATKKR